MQCNRSGERGAQIPTGQASPQYQVQRLKPLLAADPQVHSVASRQSRPLSLLPRGLRACIQSRYGIARGAFPCSKSFVPSDAMGDVQDRSHAVGQGSPVAGCVVVGRTGVGQGHHCRRVVRAQADNRKHTQVPNDNRSIPEHAISVQGRLLREAVVDPVDDVLGPLSTLYGGLASSPLYFLR